MKKKKSVDKNITLTKNAFRGPTGQKGQFQCVMDRPEALTENSFRMFRYAPVSLWEEDFSEVKRHLGHLKRSGVDNLRKYFEEHPEAVLSLAQMVRIIQVNDATINLFEAGSPEEFRDGLSLVLGKESYEVFKEELVTLSESREVFSSITTNLTLKGNRRDILITVTIPPGFEESWSKVYVAITDITALKHREREVRASEEKYRKIFGAFQNACLVADTETGIIVDANECARLLLGMSLNDIVGQHLTEIFGPGGQPSSILEGNNNQPIASGENILFIQKNGRSVPVLASRAFTGVAEKKLIVIVLREKIGEVPVERSPAGRRMHSGRLSYANRITERECEVLQLIAAGNTNPRIADLLGISRKTVETHRARIMQKLDVHTVADLVRYALAAKLVA